MCELATTNWCIIKANPRNSNNYFIIISNYEIISNQFSKNLRVFIKSMINISLNKIQHHLFKISLRCRNEITNNLLMP